MKCSFCNRQASMQITEFNNDRLREYNLCEHCLNKALSTIMNQQKDRRKNKRVQIGADSDHRLGDQHVCENCGQTFEEFLLSGRPGCKICQDTFYRAVYPYIQSFNGEQDKKPKNHHRFPNVTSSNDPKIKKVDLLRKKLQQAIEQEEYEQAADIRDKIKKLEAEN